MLCRDLGAPQTSNHDVCATRDPEWFTPDRRKELFPDRIKAFGEFVKSLGALKSLDLVERKEEDGLPAYTYRAAFSDRTMLLRLTLSPDGKIAGMRLASE
jgi:hypothetical protein